MIEVAGMKVRARFIIRTENGLVRPGETFETDVLNAKRLGNAVEIIADPAPAATSEEKTEPDKATEPEEKAEPAAEEKPKRGRRKAE